MPQLTLDDGLIADTSTPGTLRIGLDPDAVTSPDDLTPFEVKSQKGVAGGYAPLGLDNLIPSEYIPAGARGGVTTTLPFFDIREYGATTGASNNASAIQAAINAAESAGGGRVFIPQGTWMTGPLVIGRRVWLSGASMRGARLMLVANTNADFITNRLSSNGTTDGNAQFIAVTDMTIHGNLANNLTAGRGIFWTQNPERAQTTGDDINDPRMLASNVFIHNVRGNGFENDARSELTLHNVNVFYCGGHGIVVAPDSFINSCKVGAVGKAGFYIESSSVRINNCKAFFCGDPAFGTPTLGHGFHLNNTGRGVTISNSEAQDNKAAGLRIENSSHRTIVESFVADSNSKQGARQYAGVEIAGSRHCVVSFVSFERDDPQVTPGVTPVDNLSFCPQRYGLKLESGATHNRITFSHSATSGGAKLVEEAIMPVSNTAANISQNLVKVNSQDAFRTVAYAATVTPEPYSGSVIAITLTGNITIGATNVAGSPLTQAHTGMEMTFMFTQDGTGGRTVTFASQYKTSWTPVTTAGRVNIITFLFNGTSWVQTSATTGIV